MAIASELAAIARTGQVLTGSIAKRLMRCGKPNCACHAEPPQRHGPLLAMDPKGSRQDGGKWIPPEQAEDYQPWIQNSRRLRELLARLEALGIATFEADGRAEKGIGHQKTENGQK